MKEKYLVINAGSSSLKFSLYEMPEQREITNGIVEKIGEEDSQYTIKFNGEKIKNIKVIKNHTEAVDVVLAELLNYNIISSFDEIMGVGHRIVHGGEKYTESVLITDEVIRDIEELTKFATLHHPGNLSGIKAIQNVLPKVPMVAVFDTAFHQTMPPENYLYAVPSEWYTKYGVRKYGFHGTSHKYITEYMQDKFEDDDLNLIICHIGSGASISAIKNGKCYDTTMGLTPLAGLVMGTRSGDIDPAVVDYMAKVKNVDSSVIMDELNLNSGLLGLATKNDCRDLEKMANEGNESAKRALEMFKLSIEKYIAEYYIKLNGKVDAIVFTAGVGENSNTIREGIMRDLTCLGITFDKEMNDSIASFKEVHEGPISTEDSKIPVLVIPTNEEVMILKDTYKISKKLEREKVKKI